MTVRAKKVKHQAVVQLPPLVREEINGEVLEYHPLGDYVVIQPGVQGGMPTIKNTRITAGVLVGWVEQGQSPQQVAREYRLPLAAVKEALALAAWYDYDRRYA